MYLLTTLSVSKKGLDLYAYFVVYYNRRIDNNPVAQLVEQHPFKVMVVGSNPTGITMLLQIVTNKIKKKA